MVNGCRVQTEGGCQIASLYKNFSRHCIYFSGMSNKLRIPIACIKTSLHCSTYTQVVFLEGISNPRMESMSSVVFNKESRVACPSNFDPRESRVQKDSQSCSKYIPQGPIYKLLLPLPK